MRPWQSLALAALLASGCMRVITIEAEMPPLVRGLKTLKAIAPGTFTAEDETAPHLARLVAALLEAEIRNSARYELAESPGDAQCIVSGTVFCRITKGTVRRQGEDLKTRTAEIAVTFTGIAGKAMKLFTVTERPTVEDKRRLMDRFPDADKLSAVLLRACVRAFVADISPRTVRVKVLRPVLRGQRRTRRGIDLLATDPARAIDELTKALHRGPEDAAALNALGFCSEVAGNLELALSSYMYAAAIDARNEYRENMHRAYGLLERKKVIEKAHTRPEGEPQ